MPSDTRNVKLGVCRVFFDGVDLGLTKGGVEVEVATETHKVMVDQFGNSPINEYIMGRTVTAKVPLAETTIENMVRIMPGASLVDEGAAKASGTITFADAAANGNTVTINGVTFTYKTAPASDNPFELALGVDEAASASNLIAALAAVQEEELMGLVFSKNLGVVTVTTVDKGAFGNSITLAVSGADISASGAKLTGGTDATKKRVSVPTGIGIDLLSLAKTLVLHPKAIEDNDRSEDFVIPKAMTPGALQFAYKIDDERVFNTTFSGYPNSVTDELFYVGDVAA
jgi:hypothetical protein